MGKFIQDNYEAEFVIQKSKEEIWEALQKTNENQPIWLSAFPNFPGSGPTGHVIEECEPGLVKAVKDAEPCKGTEIAVHLESVENGTRVLVVQSGFPAYVKDAIETFTIGGNQIINDLVLYLDRGVSLSRHGMPWAFPGFVVNEVDAGLEVVHSMPGTFSANIGMQAGDLLVLLGDAPVFTQLDLQGLLRVFRQGEELSATWVRGNDLMSGEATL